MSQSELPGHLTSKRSLYLALIPLGVGINFAIRTIVLLLKLPICLDAIGTLIVTMRAGLRAGIYYDVANGRRESPAKYMAFIKLLKVHP